MRYTLSVIASTLAISANAAVPSLTPDNYEEMTFGKTVFIKFFAPWCGHCKSMAADWEKLAEEWDGHAVGLVAEVDCTAAGKPLCEANVVKGFPTLKYGDPSSLDDYSGARSYDALAKFATENLKPGCSLNNLDLCDDAKKTEIEKYTSMSADDLSAAIKEEEKKLADAESKFEAEVKKLQSTYEKLVANKDATIAEVKRSGLGLMRSVEKSKASSGSDEL